MNGKQGRLIAHTGAHGSGKTYSMHGHVQMLMRTYPSLKIGNITGVARDCPYKINRGSSTDAQLWIFSKLMQLEVEKRKRYDVVVSDRSIYDVIAYTAYGANDWKTADWMASMFQKNIQRYDELWFHPANVNEFCYGDGLRDTDITFRGQIDTWLSKFYHDQGIKYRVVKNGVMS